MPGHVPVPPQSPGSATPSRSVAPPTAATATSSGTHFQSQILRGALFSNGSQQTAASTPTRASREGAPFRRSRPTRNRWAEPEPEPERNERLAFRRGQAESQVEPAGIDSLVAHLCNGSGHQLDRRHRQSGRVREPVDSSLYSSRRHSARGHFAARHRSTDQPARAVLSSVAAPGPPCRAAQGGGSQEACFREPAPVPVRPTLRARAAGLAGRRTGAGASAAIACRPERRGTVSADHPHGTASAESAPAAAAARQLQVVGVRAARAVGPEPSAWRSRRIIRAPRRPARVGGAGGSPAVDGASLGSDYDQPDLVSAHS